MKLLDADYINNLIKKESYNLQTKYIKPYIHKDFEPITTNVYVVSKGDIFYDDLKQNNARGICDADTGYIYFRDDVTITAHLLIHEFIHRLSRNKFKDEWIEGIAFTDTNLYYLNEVITEMITCRITGTTETDNPYSIGLKHIDALCDKLGEFKIVRAYFNGNINFFKRKLGKDYSDFEDNFLCLIYYGNPYNFLDGTETHTEEVQKLLKPIRVKKDADNNLNIIIGRIPKYKRYF